MEVGAPAMPSATPRGAAARVLAVNRTEVGPPTSSRAEL